MYTKWHTLGKVLNSTLVTFGVRSLSKSSRVPIILRHRVPVVSCSPRFLSTQVGAQLTEFLSTEIEAEKKLGRQEQSPPAMIPGFTLTSDQAEMTLTKKFQNEVITVTFNVNHTVDADSDSKGGSETEEQPEQPQMISRPDFRIEIAKSNQKFVIDCSMTQEAEADESEEEQTESTEQQQQPDPFYISEIYVQTGPEAEKVYLASGEVIDGQLYDHLMAYLAERGIDNNFAESLTHLATRYEHSQYVGLLEKIKGFVAA